LASSIKKLVWITNAHKIEQTTEAQAPSQHFLTTHPRTFRPNTSS
jgi:hypothetical protein